jgi:hypothetical protein
MAARPKNLPRLSVEAIKELDDRPVEVIDVPEWKGSVAHRPVTEGVWQAFQEMSSPDDINYLISEAIVDPDFTPEDIATLKEKSHVAVSRISEAVLRANTPQAVLEAAERRFRAESDD